MTEFYWYWMEYESTVYTNSCSSAYYNNTVATGGLSDFVLSVLWKPIVVVVD